MGRNQHKWRRMWKKNYSHYNCQYKIWKSIANVCKLNQSSSSSNKLKKVRKMQERCLWKKSHGLRHWIYSHCFLFIFLFPVSINPCYMVLNISLKQRKQNENNKTKIKWNTWKKPNIATILDVCECTVVVVVAFVFASFVFSFDLHQSMLLAFSWIKLKHIHAQQELCSNSVIFPWKSNKATKRQKTKNRLYRSYHTHIHIHGLVV